MNRVERMKKGSPILSQAAREHIHSSGNYETDRATLTACLDELINQKIPTAQQRIEEAEQEWNRHREQQRNTGRECNEMPPEIKDRYDEATASHEVCLLEKQTVIERLENLQEPEDHARKAQVLKYGPIGSGTLRRGVLIEIDGQNVSQEADELIIDEPESPYHGMAVTDYRAMARKWTRERREKYNELLTKYRKEVKKNGSSDIKLPSINGAVPKKDLPRWPEGVTGRR